MFDNLCKSWPRESQQCINRLKNKQTSYRVLNTVLIKVLYERCGSWPQKCYGDGYSTGWLRHFIATRRYEFFNFRSAEARSDFDAISMVYLISYNIEGKDLATCPVPDLLIAYTWQHWNLSPNRRCIIKTAKTLLATPLDKYLRTADKSLCCFEAIESRAS